MIPPFNLSGLTFQDSRQASPRDPKRSQRALTAFDAQYTPRRREISISQLAVDDPFRPINRAFALLKKPLTFDYTNDQSGRRHRHSIKRRLSPIFDFRDRLSVMDNLGSLITEHRDAVLQLVRRYILLLKERCQRFLEEYDSYTPPKPSSELLSPRSRLIAQYQKGICFLSYIQSKGLRHFSLSPPLEQKNQKLQPALPRVFSK